jgi:two-component system invasion response regulator UvrY
MVRILLAEQHAVIREGLKQIVTSNRDVSISGEASSAQQALEEISRNHYDVVILDISLPGRNWLDILKELRNQRPNLPVLLLSAHADEDDAVRAFRAGASGYLTTECAQDELLTALRKVLGGGKYISNSLGERLASDLQRGTAKLPHEILSDREYQVMRLLASGRTVSEIANEMSLSIKTISTYRSRVLEKLNLKNNVELARYYTRFVDTRTVQCTKCGQDNPHMAKFCAYCGAALDPVAEIPTPMPSPQITPLKESKTLASFLRKYRWPVAILAVVVVAGLTVWLMRPSVIPNVVPTEMELKYDDGRSDLNIHADYGGYLIHFSPPAVPFLVNEVMIYGATFPSDRTQFDVQIWDERQNVIYSASHPLMLFPEIAEIEAAATKSKWVEIPLPDVEVKSDFYVHVFAGSTRHDSLQIGIDDNVKNLHSSLTILTSEGTYKMRDGWGNYTGDGWWADKDNVNWMIRVVGKKTR